MIWNCCFKMFFFVLLFWSLSPYPVKRAIILKVVAGSVWVVWRPRLDADVGGAEERASSAAARVWCHTSQPCRHRPCNVNSYMSLGYRATRLLPPLARLSRRTSWAQRWWICPAAVRCLPGTAGTAPAPGTTGRRRRRSREREEANEAGGGGIRRTTGTTRPRRRIYHRR